MVLIVLTLVFFGVLYRVRLNLMEKTVMAEEKEKKEIVAISIRMDNGLYDKLSKKAKANKRSRNAQALMILEADLK